MIDLGFLRVIYYFKIAKIHTLNVRVLLVEIFNFISFGWMIEKEQ